MSHTLSTAELRSMTMSDLKKEIRDADLSIAKLKLHIRLRKEKNTALLRAAKKSFAKMNSVLSEKAAEMLQTSKNSSKVSVHSSLNA